MVALSTYMLIFRTIHIVGGVIWVGGVSLVVMFIQPSAAAVGPAAGPFVQELLGKRKLPIRLLGVGAVTIVAGLLAYWHDWQASGSFGDWVSSRLGAVLTVGAVLAIIAWLIGLLGLRPVIARTLALGAEIAGAGSPTAPERLAEMQRLQARSRSLAQLVLAILVVAVLAMASARYW